MGPEMKLFVEVSSAVIEITTPVVEVGSAKIAEGVPGDLRPYFIEPYIGLDMSHDAGVDLIGDVRHLPFRDGRVGTFVSVATLEHVADPIKALDEIYRCLQYNGTIIVTSLFRFPIHAYPNDYWRFTPECSNLLLNKYAHRIICYLGHPKNPIWVMGIGFKSNNCEETACFEATARLILETYLQKLSDLCDSSLERDLLRRWGLAVAKGMEFSGTLYCQGSISFQLQSKVG